MLYILEDCHDDPVVQENIAAKIMELHRERRIGAVLVENIAYTGRPMRTLPLQPTPHYFNHMPEQRPQFYGVDDKELHEEHLRAAELVTEIRQAGCPEERETELYETIGKVMALTIVRSQRIMSNSTQLMREQTMPDAALVCGVAHRKSLLKFADFPYRWEPITNSAGRTVHEESEEKEIELREIIGIDYSTGL